MSKKSTENHFNEQTFKYIDFVESFKVELEEDFNIVEKWKEGLYKYVECPLLNLVNQLKKQLPQEITQITRKKPTFEADLELCNFSIDLSFFSPKNLYNAGIYILANREGLHFGFCTGKSQALYGYWEDTNDENERKRFVRNVRQNKVELAHIFTDRLDCEALVYGDNWREPGTLNWAQWLKDISIKDQINISRLLDREEIVQSSHQHLSKRIAHTFILMFPFFLLAIDDNPMPAILDFVKKPLVEFYQNTGVESETLHPWIRAIHRKKQVILQGPPGTGKTYLAKQLAKYLVGYGDGFSELVQFHPAYAYEDFIQGIRPQVNSEGQLHYPVVPGRFLEFCQKAASCEGTCVLIIDEINRSNLSSVFGELMYLLEYRDEKILLAGSNELFGIPANVRIIGTMNTADRSIALVDYALRRRFAFIEVLPNYDILCRYHEREKTDFPVEGLIATLQEVNQQINDPHYELGISFFLLPDIAEQIEDIWRMEIEPYLQEYFFDQLEKAHQFRWETVKKRIVP